MALYCIMAYYEYSDSPSHYYFIATQRNPTALKWNNIDTFFNFKAHKLFNTAVLLRAHAYWV